MRQIPNQIIAQAGTENVHSEQLQATEGVKIVQVTPENFHHVLALIQKNRAVPAVLNASTSTITLL